MTQSLVSAAPTLREVWADYRNTRPLKESTKTSYRNKLYLLLPDWLDMPICDITKDMVEERHRILSNNKSERGAGQAQANLVMRILRALVNFASIRYEESVKGNPVRRLSEARSWNRIRRRKNYITPLQMSSFYQAVMSLHNKTMRDYYLTLVFTGMRRNEAARLRWSWVDLDEATIKIPGDVVKNGEDLCVPIPSYLLHILRERSRRSRSKYVFNGRKLGEPIMDWRASHHAVVVRSGIDFRIHDIRRTFLTIGDSLDIPRHVLKRLVNHKYRDVTDDYIIPSVERLRKPSEQIAKEIIRQATELSVSSDPPQGEPLPVPRGPLPGEPLRRSKKPRNANVRVGGVDQLIMEAKILAAVKKGARTKKQLYPKLGASYKINASELARILDEMVDCGLLSSFREEPYVECWRYQLGDAWLLTPTS
jgi:integrase